MPLRKQIFTLVILALSAISAFAAIPQQINYQGKLTDASNIPVTGSYTIVFKIYDAESAGAALWTETRTVTTESGFFNVLLGAVSSIETTVFTSEARYLGIKVGDDSEMAPRQKLVSVGYAFKAHDSDNLGGYPPEHYTGGSGGVTTGEVGKVPFYAVAGNTIEAASILYWNKTSSNLGIGTPEPSATLEVIGTVKATSFEGSGAALTGITATDGTKVLKAGDTMTGSLTMETGSLIVSTGNVGIGTAEPTQLLHVRKDVDALVAIRLQNNSDTANSNVYLDLNASNVGSSFLVYPPSASAAMSGFPRSRSTYLRTSTGSPSDRLVIATGSSAPIHFSTYDTHAMTINVGGNVGIGTTNPTGKFQVATAEGRADLFVKAANGFVGIGTAEPASILHVYNTTGATLWVQADKTDGIAALRLANDARAWTMGVRGDMNDLFVINDATLGLSRLAIDTSGNVGIGSAEPASKLTVAGTIEITGAGNGIKFPSGNVQTDAATSSQWTTNAGNIYYNSGNVGIGVAAPIAKLQILSYVTPETGVSSIGLQVYQYVDKGWNNTYPQNILATQYRGSETQAAIYGSTGYAIRSGSGDVSQATGILGRVQNISSGAITTGYSVYAQGPLLSNGGTIGTIYGLRVSNQGSSEVTNAYGVYIDPQINATTNNYALYSGGGTNYFGGNVSIGTTDAVSKLTVLGTIETKGTGGVKFSDGSTLTSANTASGWTHTGTYEILTTSTDYVGIGTTAPAQKLDVSGSGEVMGANNVNAKGTVIIRDGATSADHRIALMLSKSYEEWNSDTDRKISMVFGNNSYNPQHYWGRISGGKATGTNGGAGYLSFHAGNDSSSATDHMIILSTGNVGIGTTNPLGKLDVAESGIVSAVFGADNGLSTRTNNTYKVARLGAVHYTNTEEPVAIMVIGNDVSANSLIIGGGSSLLNAASVISFNTAANSTTTIGTERMRLNSAGAVSIGTTDAVSKLTVMGTIETKGTGGIKFNDGTTLTSANSVASGWTDGTGTVYVTSTTDKVGIGTTVPEMRADIAGTAGNPATTGTIETGALRIRNTASNNVLDFGSSNASPFPSWIQSTDRANLATNYPLLLNPNGGNVSIGTTDAVSKLTVGGTIETKGTGGIKFNDGTTLTSANSVASGWTDGTGTVYVTSTTDKVGIGTTNPTGKFQVATAEGRADLFVKAANGNVGIGTAEPLGKLHVYGDTYIGSGVATYPSTPAGIIANLIFKGSTDMRMTMNDGAGNFSQYLNSYYDAATSTHKYAMSNYASRFLTTAGTFVFYVAPSGIAGNNITWETAMNINNSGNVGIGIAAEAGTQLHVTADGGEDAVRARINVATSEVILGGTSAGAYMSSLTYDRDVGNLYVKIGTNAAPNTAITVLPTGNVGIGTTIPIAKLDIQAASSAAYPYGLYINNWLLSGHGITYPQNHIATRYNVATTTQGSTYGLVAYATKDNTGPITGAVGLLGRIQNNNASGAIVSATAVLADGPIAVGPITTAYGLYANTQKIANVTTGYGVYQIGSSDLNYFAGKVGIGDANPSYKLNVSFPSQTTEGVRFIGQDSHALIFNPSLPLGATNSLVQAGDTAIIYTNSAVNTGALVIGPWSNVAGGVGIRMDSSGNVGIGTTAPGQALTVNGTIECNLAAAFATGYVGYVAGSGTRSKLGKYSSSKRYKKDISNLTLGLDVVKKLRPVSFKWKGDGRDDLGFIAEEVAEIDPILAFYEKGVPESVKYMQFTALLTKAIQEQQAEIEAQRKENAALKARIERLEEKLGR